MIKKIVSVLYLSFVSTLGVPLKNQEPLKLNTWGYAPEVLDIALGPSKPTDSNSLLGNRKNSIYDYYENVGFTPSGDNINMGFKRVGSSLVYSYKFLSTEFNITIPFFNVGTYFIEDSYYYFDIDDVYLGVGDFSLTFKPMASTNNGTNEGALLFLGVVDYSTTFNCQYMNSSVGFQYVTNINVESSYTNFNYSTFYVPPSTTLGIYNTSPFYYNLASVFWRSYDYNLYNQGYTHGVEDTLEDGVGFSEGYALGYDFGFSQGREEGFNDGLDFENNGSMFAWVRSLFSGMSDIFSVSLFGDFTIGTLALIVVVFTLVPFLLGLFRGRS